MLQLLGVNIPTYTFSNFSYNGSSFEATWSLPTAIGVDRLMLSLNGEAAPPGSGSGPNIAADPFNIDFAVLPGDVNGDGLVSASDLIAVRNDIMTGTYSIWADVDGNGVVDLTDYSNVRRRSGLRLP